MTFYEILEVSPSASREVIEASWKALQRRYHPDGSQPNQERSKAINQAHDVLSDPAKRKQYDLQLKAQRPQPVKIPVKRETVKAQRRRAAVEVRRQKDLVDGLVELANLAFEIFETPINVRRRR
jgi:curved DNA-binding protein CbpA